MQVANGILNVGQGVGVPNTECLALEQLNAGLFCVVSQRSDTVR